MVHKATQGEVVESFQALVRDILPFDKTCGNFQRLKGVRKNYPSITSVDFDNPKATVIPPSLMV